MEFLHLLSQDTKLNIIPSASTESDQLEVKPALNVFVLVNDSDQIDKLLQLQSNDHDVVVYFTSTQPYKEEEPIKCLLTRVYNHIHQQLLCDSSLYHKLQHYHHLKWLRPNNILHELVNCHSPFGRVLINYHLQTLHLSCDQAVVNKVDTLIDGINYESKHSNLYAGLILFEDEYDVTKYQPDFIAVFNHQELNQEPNFSYYYKWDGCVIWSKRSLSTIVTSLQQLSKIELQVHTLDVVHADTSIIDLFHTYSIPCTLTLQNVPPENTLVINEGSIINNNFNTFIQYLRKLPSLQTFGIAMFDHHHLLINDSINDTYGTVKALGLEEVMSTASSYLYSSSTLSTCVITPYLPVVKGSKLQLPSHSSTIYYTPSLGDADLADQMTEYACIANDFEVGVDPAKVHTKMIQLQSTFQNIRLKEIAQPISMSFDLAIQPQKSSFVFKSSILLQAQQYLSKFNQTCPFIVGVHQKCRKYKRSFTLSSSLEYYEHAIKHIVSINNQPTFLLANSSKSEVELIPLLQSLQLKYELIPDTIPIPVQLAILTLTDGLILSTSTFAFWAGVMNKHSQCTVCPTKWVSDIYAMAYKSYHDKCIQPSWVAIHN